MTRDGNEQMWNPPYTWYDTVLLKCAYLYNVFWALLVF